VDRPAVYRALAQLERDGLVEASSQNPKAGQARRVYQVTQLGQQVLRMWMSVVKEEHDHLGHVLRRYQATGTTDAVLAEVEGGWAAALGVGWSAVSSTSVGRKGSSSMDSDLEFLTPDLEGFSDNSLSGEDQGDGWDDYEPPMSLFHLDRNRSVVLIEVRSSVGPLSFGATGVKGSIEANVVDGVFHTGIAPSGSLEIDVSELRSGNSLYDAELHRRIDARRYPTAKVELSECASGLGSRYGLKGDLTFHGVTRPAQGTVSVEVLSDRRLVITGEQVFDIRDFAVPSPTMLMLRIYPDVRVRLHAEAELEEAS
jgi:hypothetical protein